MLQVLLPDANILQDSILDGAEVQRIKSAIAEKLPGSNDEISRALDYLHAADLYAVRNPVDAWTSPHPHWLDRIARIEKLLGTNDLAGSAAQARPPYNVRPDLTSPNRYAAGLSVLSAQHTYMSRIVVPQVHIQMLCHFVKLQQHCPKEVALLQHIQQPMLRSDLQPVFHIVHTKKHMFVSALPSFSIIDNF